MRRSCPSCLELHVLVIRLLPLFSLLIVLFLCLAWANSRPVQAGPLAETYQQGPLLQNPSFEMQEGDPTPWIFVGPCNFYVYTTTGIAYDGNNYLATNSNNNIGCTSFYQDIALTPVVSQTYRFAIWGRASINVIRRAELVIWASGSEGVKGNTFHTISGPKWQCLETSLTITQTGATGLRTEIYYHSTDSIDYYFDSAVFQVGGPPICPATFALTAASPPGNGGVIPQGVISATFEAALDPGTVTTRTFTVRGQQTGVYTGSYILPTSDTIRFDPVNAFKPGETVEVGLNLGLQSSNSNNVKPHTWRFRTAVVEGVGTFTRSQQLFSMTNMCCVALGYLNRDSHLDIFIAGRRPGTPHQVWINDSRGNFTNTGQILDGAETEAIALGDLNGDGSLDVFIGTDGYQPDEIWFNDGQGNFSDSGQRLGETESFGVSLGDVDGDGDLDAFVNQFTGQGQELWLNDGLGNFSDSTQRIGFRSTWGIGGALGDLNGDGSLDAFVPNWNNLPDQVWFNDGQGYFYNSGQALGNSDSQGVALGDLDGDGSLDAFVVSQDREPDEVWLNDGQGGFSLEQQLGSSSGERVLLGDLDADGDLDAFIVTEANEPDEVWLKNEHGYFEDSNQRLGLANGTSGGLGDLDGDGDLDAVVGNRDQFTEIWLNQRFAVLSIEKNGPLAAPIGHPIPYTLIIENMGNLTATNLVITDAIPAGATYLGGGTRVGNIISWTVAELPPKGDVMVQFEVTATQTITNSDYGVLMEGGVPVPGNKIVVTVAQPPNCPDIPPDSVCVLTEGSALPDALVYRNGQFAGFTGNGGILTFTTLLTNDELIALQPIYDQLTNKGAHKLDTQANVAFRLYRTNFPISNNGATYPYLVPGSGLSHTLIISSANALILFNLVVSLDWEADPDYIDQLKAALRLASNGLYNATDGQMAFGWVAIYDHGENWADADIQIRAHNRVRPWADVGGITNNGAGRLSYKEFKPNPGHITLGRYWNGYDGSSGGWDKPPGYMTLLHEFMHYGLLLFDEYFYYQKSGNQLIWQPSQCSIQADDPGSIMYDQYSKTEFCNRPEQYDLPTRQTQVYGPDETSWNTIIGVFSDTLRARVATPWLLRSPVARGVDFVAGPALLPLNLPNIEDRTGISSSFTKLITVIGEDAPVEALVFLEYTVDNDPKTVYQGLTDVQGNIKVLGAHLNNRICAQTLDIELEDRLGGCLTVTGPEAEILYVSSCDLSADCSDGPGHKRGWTGGPADELNLISGDGNLILYALAGTFPSSTTVTVDWAEGLPQPPPGLQLVSLPYLINAKTVGSDTAGIQSAELITQSQQPIALTLAYHPDPFNPPNNTQLRLYYHNGQGWAEVKNQKLDSAAPELHSSINRFGLYTLMIRQENIYLPIIIK